MTGNIHIIVILEEYGYVLFGAYGWRLVLEKVLDGAFDAGSVSRL